MKNGERRARAMPTVVVLTTAEAAGQRRSWRSDSDGAVGMSKTRRLGERRE
jgi:hypothetical protein